MNRRCSVLVLAVLLVSATTAFAETLTLEDAVARALESDPRISELEYLAESAKTLVAEAEGSGGVIISLNTFLGIAPAVNGGLFKNDTCGVVSACEPRDDRQSLHSGLSPWTYLAGTIVKPLYTFGKIENYSAAAKANVKVKEEDTRVQRGKTMRDVKLAYFGHLASRDGVSFLADVQARLDAAQAKVNAALDNGDEGAKQSDVYAIQTARAVVAAYLSQAKGLQKISLDGLRVLTGVGLSKDLTLADERLAPLPLPQADLQALQAAATTDRPELTQLEEGLKARRALVAASKSMAKPNIYAGVSGMATYSPRRDKLQNPHIYDPFNDYGATPMIGLKWDFAPGVHAAKVDREQAELNALIEKSSFANRGIPFQVAEAYNKVQASHAALKSLEEGAKAGRRWMISTYSDFDAGLEKVDKVVGAFQGYVLAYSEYLKTVFDYNMQVVDLDIAVGAYK